MDDADKPATKQDVEQAVKAAKDELLEVVRGIETKLLEAFYSYAKSNDKRLFEVEGNEAVLRSRVALIENRVTDIEHRLNMPPKQ